MERHLVRGLPPDTGAVARRMHAPAGGDAGGLPPVQPVLVRRLLLRAGERRDSRAICLSGVKFHISRAPGRTDFAASTSSGQAGSNRGETSRIWASTEPCRYRPSYGRVGVQRSSAGNGRAAGGSTFAKTLAYRPPTRLHTEVSGRSRPRGAASGRPPTTDGCCRRGPQTAYECATGDEESVTVVEITSQT